MHYHFFAVFVGIYTVVGGRKCENFYIVRHQCEVFFIRRYAQKIMGHPVERYKEVLHGGGGDGREREVDFNFITFYPS
tara:strand:+ start:384 stop:617 length:234 start_codon:yes stop_codon:yes gene_type:complete